MSSLARNWVFPAIPCCADIINIQFCYWPGSFVCQHSNHSFTTSPLSSKCRTNQVRSSSKSCYKPLKMDLSVKMIRDIPSVVSHHWKEKNLNFPMIVYISLVHTVALVGLFTIPKCSAETLIWAFILWPIRWDRYSPSLILLWKDENRLSLCFRGTPTRRIQ